jgi:hypothetical protein
VQALERSGGADIGAHRVLEQAQRHVHLAQRAERAGDALERTPKPCGSAGRRLREYDRQRFAHPPRGHAGAVHALRLGVEDGGQTVGESTQPQGDDAIRGKHSVHGDRRPDRSDAAPAEVARKH